MMQDKREKITAEDEVKIGALILTRFRDGYWDHGNWARHPRRNLQLLLQLPFGYLLVLNVVLPYKLYKLCGQRYSSVELLVFDMAKQETRFQMDGLFHYVSDTRWFRLALHSDNRTLFNYIYLGDVYHRKKTVTQGVRGVICSKE